VDNLHRQVLYSHQDIGKPKAEVAAQKLATLNPHIKISAILQRLDSHNALAIFKNYDLIVDGSDNFPTRYLINDAAVLSKKPLTYGAIYKYEGQVSVFNAHKADGTRSANYRDLFPTPPEKGSVPSCSEIGVIGVLPGIIGSLQANEVIKLITGIGDPLIEKLYTLDTLTLNSFTLKYNSLSSTNIKELIDYETFCDRKIPTKIETISAIDLETIIRGNENIKLIDVRQTIEHQYGNLPSINIPIGELVENLVAYNTDEKIILYCKTGSRSEKAIQIMLEHGYTNIAHLNGGLVEYIKHFNSDINIL